VVDQIFFDGVGEQRIYVSRNNDLVIVRVREASVSWDESILPNSVVDALQ